MILLYVYDQLWCLNLSATDLTQQQRNLELNYAPSNFQIFLIIVDDDIGYLLWIAH